MQHVIRLDVSRLCVALQCMVSAAALHARRYALVELRAAVLTYVKSSFFLMHRTSLGGGVRWIRFEGLRAATASGSVQILLYVSMYETCEWPNT